MADAPFPEPAPESRKPVTVPIVRGRKHRRKLIMVTAYDYPSALAADRAGVDVILVGDSVANVVLGYRTTNQVTLNDMIHHTAAVSRARPKALVVADLPWMTFHVTPEDTLSNAARLIREGGAGAVKLEGGAQRVEMVRKLVSAEIPVMGHVGLTPQSVHVEGGYRLAGRNPAAVQRLIEDVHALEEAGVFAIVLEAIPAAVARVVTARVGIPTIGIGAGPDTDGQVLVFHDLVGLNFGRYPRFARRYAPLGELAVEALTEWKQDVLSGAFPDQSESYQEIEPATRELLDRMAAPQPD